MHSHDEYAVLDAIGKKKIDLSGSKRFRKAWDKAVETVTGNSVKGNDQKRRETVEAHVSNETGGEMAELRVKLRTMSMDEARETVNKLSAEEKEALLWLYITGNMI